MKRLTPMVCLAVSACLHPVRVAREPLPQESTLNVVTWNVNYGLAGAPDAIAAMEEATRDADLVLLQETNAEWEAQLETRLATRFPHQHWLDDAAAGGQAVLSRRPFVLREVIPAPSGWFPALRIEAQTRIGAVQVLSVHLHPPISDSGSMVSGYLGTGQIRRRELETFTASLVRELPTLIVGDFNEGTSGDAIGWAQKQKFRSALPEFSPRADTWHWPVDEVARAARTVRSRALRAGPRAARRAGTAARSKRSLPGAREAHRRLRIRAAPANAVRHVAGAHFARKSLTRSRKSAWPLPSRMSSEVTSMVSTSTPYFPCSTMGNVA